MRLSIETASALRKAGYQQSLPKNDPIHIEGGVLMPSFPDAEGVMTYCPPLWHLIEACGEQFTNLDRLKHGWEAYATLETKGFGSTPEEAVARLYIALHNHTNGNTTTEETSTGNS